MRRGRFVRETKETRIEVEIELDGTGKSSIETGIPFFDHLLTSFSFHGLFDLSIRASGDLDVDDHHTVEDVAISLGKAFREALKDSAPVRRFGFAIIPMDESLATLAVDISGRPYLSFSASFFSSKIGSMSTQMIEHFFRSFSYSSNLTIHASASGSNDHHKAEALFKAFGVALDMATQIERRREISPSTKGIIDS
ncbi:MAG: imidazoleglycerol-phosphate dehydratase [Archaeoglobi archaeon]|nr:imidazoleglycerol-phosphate dehydratase HisB [Candidatus Mnemosynella bozhongmuii]MDI3502697.1 imidazoleglycerol-phosphate dehydratase [Archaeoglobi archaeon]